MHASFNIDKKREKRKICRRSLHVFTSWLAGAPWLVNLAGCISMAGSQNLKLFGSLKLFSLIKGLGVWKVLNKRFCRIIHSHDFEEITDNFLVFTSLFPPSLNPKTYNYIQESRFLCLYWRSRNLLQKRWTRSVTYTADLELDYMGALATTTATATKTSLKKWSRAASNFIALIPSCSIHQMLSVVPGVEL